MSLTTEQLVALAEAQEKAAGHPIDWRTEFLQMARRYRMACDMLAAANDADTPYGHEMAELQKLTGSKLELDIEVMSNGSPTQFRIFDYSRAYFTDRFHTFEEARISALRRCLPADVTEPSGEPDIEGIRAALAETADDPGVHTADLDEVPVTPSAA